MRARGEGLGVVGGLGLVNDSAEVAEPRGDHTDAFFEPVKGGATEAGRG